MAFLELTLYIRLASNSPLCLQSARIKCRATKHCWITCIMFQKCVNSQESPYNGKPWEETVLSAWRSHLFYVYKKWESIWRIKTVEIWKRAKTQSSSFNVSHKVSITTTDHRLLSYELIICLLKWQNSNWWGLVQWADWAVLSIKSLVWNPLLFLVNANSFSSSSDTKKVQYQLRIHEGLSE